MRLPAECTNMTELRAEIDRLDAALIGLLVERTSYIDRAIALKAPQGLPARIPERVEEVLANVRMAAAGQGLDPALAEAVWRLIVDWSIAREARILGDEEGAA
ncbi:MAG: chorismate mutase [Roseinatronobacter sp.]